MLKIIPFSSRPEKFSITLNDRQLIIAVNWNVRIWEITISDVLSQITLVAGLPLVTGCDILEQYEYLGLGGIMFISQDSGSKDTPTFYNLGKDCNLFFNSAN
jgi:hypothetical protein